MHYVPRSFRTADSFRLELFISGLWFILLALLW